MDESAIRYVNSSRKLLIGALHAYTSTCTYMLHFSLFENCISRLMRCKEAAWKMQYFAWLLFWRFIRRFIIYGMTS